MCVRTGSPSGFKSLFASSDPAKSELKLNFTPFAALRERDAVFIQQLPMDFVIMAQAIRVIRLYREVHLPATVCLCVCVC